MSNATFAAALADVFERQAADTITEPEAAAEIETAIGAWAGLSTTNPQLASQISALSLRVANFIAIAEGVFVLNGPPNNADGELGAYAIDTAGRAFYGPKGAGGWGDPSYVLDGADATITIGAVQSVAQGQEAVRNVGSPTEAVFRV